MNAPTLLPAIAPYVPAALIHAVTADPAFTDAPVTTSFEAAVLFADVSGFTPLTEALAQKGPEGPEEMRTLINRYFTAMIDLTRAEGGDVVKFSGDAMTVLYVARDEPLSYAVRRAYQSAEAMQRAMAPFANLHTSVGPVELGMKIMIGAGPVLALQVGGVFNRWEYVIVGDPLRQVGLAEEHAQRGDIILSPEAAVVRHSAPLPPRPLTLPDWETLPQPAAVESNLLRFVPGPVLAWLNQGLANWAPALRRMTVLFVGVQGLQYDHPDITERLHAFLRQAQETLYNYEGTLRQFVVDDKGTVLMALFGAPPFAHEDDPARACLCAQRLQQVTAALDLQLALGLATGQVFSGPVGGETRYEYTAMGDTVNLAARLMGKAGPGGTLCEFETYSHARATLQFENLTPIRVKGKAGPIRVYRPLGRVEAVAHSSRSHPSTVVGRRTEIKQFTNAVYNIIAGAHYTFILSGEAGMGKSRLLAELMRLTKEQGLVWLIGAGESIEQQTPYRAWRDIFTFYFGLEHLYEPQERRRRMQAVSAELDDTLTLHLPLLNDILNLGLAENELTRSLDPQLRQQALTTLVLTLLRTWLKERPLVLILEDAQWLDSLSWLLTVEVARAFVATHEPLLLAIATRPPRADSVGAQALETLEQFPTTEVMALSPLEGADIVTLVADRLEVPRERIPLSLLDLVNRWTDGNPLYVEELLQTLAERGVISRQLNVDGVPTCLVQEDLEEMAHILPDTVQGLVLARIDRQPPERQLILKTAAVIGRIFSYAPLSYVLHQQTTIADTTLKPHLDALSDLKLTACMPDEPELMYIFRQIITREVAYETLLFSQRRVLHRTVAEWYEAQSAQRVGTEPGATTALAPYLSLLAYHYQRAEVPDKERYYAELAGKQAAAQFANTDALRYFTRALTLTPSTDATKQFDLLLARESIYALQGQHEAQEQDLIALTHLADVLSAEARAEILLRRARYAEVHGAYPEAVTLSQAAIAEAQTAGDQRAEAAGYFQWGRILWLQGQYPEATPYLEQALRLAQAGDFGQVEADSMRSLGVIAYYHGDQQGGALCFRQALKAFRRIGDRRGEASALNNLGVVYFNRGEYIQARDYYQQGLDLYREVGHRQGVGRAVGNLGIIAHNLGDYAGARTYYEQALHIYKEVGYRQGISILFSYLSLLFYHLGDPKSAQDYGLRAHLLAQDLNDSLTQGFALTNSGHALTAIGRWVEAADHYRRAYEIRQKAQQYNLAMESLTGLAEVYLLQDELDSAQPYLAQILDYLKKNSLDGVIEPFWVHWTCYRLLRAQCNPRAATLLAHTYTTLQTQAARIDDEALRQSFLKNVSVHRQILEEFERVQRLINPQD